MHIFIYYVLCSSSFSFWYNIDGVHRLLVLAKTATVLNTIRHHQTAFHDPSNKSPARKYARLTRRHNEHPVSPHVQCVCISLHVTNAGCCWSTHDGASSCWRRTMHPREYGSRDDSRSVKKIHVDDDCVLLRHRLILQFGRARHLLGSWTIPSGPWLHFRLGRSEANRPNEILAPIGPIPYGEMMAKTKMSRNRRETRKSCVGWSYRVVAVVVVAGSPWWESCGS